MSAFKARVLSLPLCPFTSLRRKMISGLTVTHYFTPPHCGDSITVTRCSTPKLLQAPNRGTANRLSPQMARATPFKNRFPTCPDAAMQRRCGRREKPLFLYKTIGGVTFVTFVAFIQVENAAHAKGCGGVGVSAFLAPKRHHAGASHADRGTPNRLSLPPLSDHVT